jgi:uncharacterized membrane protein
MYSVYSYTPFLTHFAIVDHVIKEFVIQALKLEGSANPTKIAPLLLIAILKVIFAQTFLLQKQFAQIWDFSLDHVDGELSALIQLVLHSLLFQKVQSSQQMDHITM